MYEDQIDYGFRPERYFWPMEIEKNVLTKIKGSSRRRAVKEWIMQGKLQEIPEDLVKGELDEEVRTAIGKIHPSLMGGEYLPAIEEEELIIAAVSIHSTLCDTVAVMARKEKGQITYRVVDEYNGETLRKNTTLTSRKPLTLWELLNFFLGAWDFLDVVAGNCSYSVPDMLEWFDADSEYYPELYHALCEELIEAYTPEE